MTIEKEFEGAVIHPIETSLVFDDEPAQRLSVLLDEIPRINKEINSCMDEVQRISGDRSITDRAAQVQELSDRLKELRQQRDDKWDERTSLIASRSK